MHKKENNEIIEEANRVLKEYFINNSWGIADDVKWGQEISQEVQRSCPGEYEIVIQRDAERKIFLVVKCSNEHPNRRQRTAKTSPR